MTTIILSQIVLIGSGSLALLARRAPRLAAWIGALGAVAGSILGLIAAVPAITRKVPLDLQWAWNVPYGSFHLGLDALSGFFLVPILLVSGVGAVYGLGYLRREPGQSIAGAWFFYNILVASMALVVVARNGILFLVGWEVMALSSFFLVTHAVVSGGRTVHKVREGGLVYQIAAHLGTAFLLVMFTVLGAADNSMEFSAMHAQGAAVPAGVLFVMALIGFGAKAGFVPLHIWLPEAHPVAPSHVSAVMSGVMIKTGIYGILRVLTMLGPPQIWWGWVLIGIGVTSGILGILYALVQPDLKRLLAYCSVENIGIIALALGVGLVGQQAGLPRMAALGYIGALVHVVNHALFKGLLFLAAGAVDHGAGSLRLEALGGLQKRMPWTAGFFLLGSVAIAGLPPLNGFVSEFCIYLGALRGATAGTGGLAPILGLVIAALGLIGGLSVACFTKAYGVSFQGIARTEGAGTAHEAGWLMRGAMLVLALGCVGVASMAWMVLPQLEPLVSQLSGLPTAEAVAAVAANLRGVALISGSVWVIVAVLAVLRWALLSGREVTTGATWGCGYGAPNNRMQFTASSYAEPLTDLFAPLLKTRERINGPDGFFPAQGSYASRIFDQARVRGYAPMYRLIMTLAAWLRRFQAGRVQTYILYIAITIFVLLILTVRR